MSEEQRQSANSDALAEAQELIARQGAEIQRLRQLVADNRFADELRQSLILAGAVGAIATAPAYEQLLMLILETAAQVINASAASISLVDEEQRELVIEHALGPRGREAKGVRLPLGHGIAGLVAASGQPMAISNAGRDPRHAAEIAARIGYQPDTILCVPLIYEERVIGVLELMDKAGGRSFTPADIETLGGFGTQAAIVIEQSRLQTSVSGLIGLLLSSPDRAGAAAGAGTAARAFAATLQEASSYQETLELAQLVRQFASLGELERQLCASLLRGQLQYFGARPQLSFMGRIG